MNESSSKDKLTRAAGSVSLATLISRILGFIRDMIIADLFGAKAAADAFFVAFRIPNLLRRFTAEGALTAAFVPVYSETLEKGGKARAFALACNLITILALCLMIITALGIILAPWIVKVIAPGFTYDKSVFDLTTVLTQMMFPYIFLISIAAVMMAMLNAMGRFFIPAIAPAALNLAIITCALLLYDRFAEPTMSLAVGVLIGGLLQLALQFAQLRKTGWKYKPSFDLKDKATIKIGALMVPAAFGMAVAEVNIFIDTLLASMLPEGSVSYLFYGNRVVQFPLGVFGIAVGIAALPSMSGEVARGQEEKLVELLSHALRLTLFISIPSMVGLLVLAEPVCNVLFERGAFDETARVGSAFALALYAVGLTAFAGVKVVVSAFYSVKDVSTPTRVAVWSMVLNIALNLALIGPLQHGGLALATSISSIFNVLILLILFRKRAGSIDGPAIFRSALIMSLCASLMGAAVYGYTTLFFSFDGSIVWRVYHLLIAIIVGIATYGGSMLVARSREALSLKKRILGN